jgi:predicted Ser/Thr protein kinase
MIEFTPCSYPHHFDRREETQKKKPRKKKEVMKHSCEDPTRDAKLIVTRIGKGVVGETFRICPKNNPSCGVLVKKEFTDDFNKDRFLEITAIEKKLAEAGVAPRVLDKWVCFPNEIKGDFQNAIVYTTMQYVEGIPFSKWKGDGAKAAEVCSALLKKLRIMHHLGIMHSDLHADNILIDTKSGEPWIIDFDSAVEADGPLTCDQIHFDATYKLEGDKCPVVREYGESCQ